MADAIAVMNKGRIEQLGPPSELYEKPATAFVAGFLGVSNLLHGSVTDRGRVRLDTGDEIAADPGERTGRVAVGIRPEKIRIGPPGEGDNSLAGTVKETAYVGVATQYVVETGAGTLIVYVQNDGSGTLAPARCCGNSQLEPTRDLRRRPSTGGFTMTPPLTRRQLLERAALGGAALTLPGFLAACGGGGRRDGCGDDRRRRRADAREHAPLRQLAALHRRRREDEEAADARPVHEEDGRLGRLLRGDQLERRVLREDPGPALARPGDRPRHHRPHRQLALSRPDGRGGVGREARQGRDPEHRQPRRRAPEPALRPRPDATRCRGSPA